MWAPALELLRSPLAKLAGCRVIALDISAEALAVAKENAEINGVAELIEFKTV